MLTGKETVATLRRWIPALDDDQWDLQCFWAQKTTRAGLPVIGPPNVCSYMRVFMTGANWPHRTASRRHCISPSARCCLSALRRIREAWVE